MSDVIVNVQLDTAPTQLLGEANVPPRLVTWTVAPLGTVYGQVVPAPFGSLHGDPATCCPFTKVNTVAAPGWTVSRKVCGGVDVEGVDVGGVEVGGADEVTGADFVLVGVGCSWSAVGRCVVHLRRMRRDGPR